jgi:hypothetical protein
MEATAKVIPWGAKPALASREKAPTAAELEPNPPGFGLEVGPLEEYVVMISDDQLDALGAIFYASPLRRAMTFEGYLIAKGFGHPVS